MLENYAYQYLVIHLIFTLIKLDPTMKDATYPW